MKANEKFQEFIYTMHQNARQHDVTLIYEGEINHSLTKAFAFLAESILSKENETITIRRRVFHVIVEFLQNITRHAKLIDDSGREKSRTGIFLVTKTPNEYCVSTGNVVDKEHAEELQEVLNKLNTMPLEELDESYKNQLKNGKISDKGGAGLGLIDIARKTGNAFKYNFLPVSDKYSFFLLSSVISRQS